MGRKKRLAIIAGSIVLVILLVAGLLIFTPVGKNFTGWVKDGVSSLFNTEPEEVVFEHSPDAGKYTGEASEPDGQSSDAKKAADAIESGNASLAESIYDEAINSASSPEEKAKIYLERSDAFYNSENHKDINKALEYALEADKAKSSGVTSARLVSIYSEIGDQEKVDEYTKKLQGFARSEDETWKQYYSNSGE